MLAWMERQQPVEMQYIPSGPRSGGSEEERTEDWYTSFVPSQAGAGQLLVWSLKQNTKMSFYNRPVNRGRTGLEYTLTWSLERN